MKGISKWNFEIDFCNALLIQYVSIMSFLKIVCDRERERKRERARARERERETDRQKNTEKEKRHKKGIKINESKIQRLKQNEREKMGEGNRMHGMVKNYTIRAETI